ncbi:MAG: 5-formyltetrahydrofolate cyclo-ligase [Sedimentisphaerales bacterium]|nr:5-formyltetrahydrofolate cyclo-ligase [Sedimentisphaerales bacterium]
MMTDTHKGNLRRHLRELADQMTDEQVAEKSLVACDLLCKTPEFAQAKVVMFFLSLSHEVETEQAIWKAFDSGKAVLVPKVDWTARKMMAVKLSGTDAELIKEPIGQLRSPKEIDPVEASTIDLVVVPGLGFDKSGNRLGLGGGFYDRYLSGKDFRGIKCGLAFEEQVVEEIPVADHDQEIDMLVTNSEVRRFNHQ